MNVGKWLNEIQSSSLAAAVRGDSGWEWLFPNIETCHVIALALVFGSILMVDLRLLGIASRDSAVSKLSAECLPYTWIAFLLAAITGTLLFISRAHTYFYNLQFQLKFAFMALAGLNMAAFHFGAYRHVLEWDIRLPPPPQARLAGALSIALWTLVIFCGRWIGFKT
jgi:uncharacterized integral membrane protein